MTNKISNLNNPALQEAAPVAVPGGGAGGAGVVPGRLSPGGSPAPEGASATSDVHITSSASQLASLEHTVRSLPAVDEARVAPLRTAIEQGSYSVQPQHVADQLIQLEQALAGLSGD
jgi:negative regulator of flagellin synthesis FlgM